MLFAAKRKILRIGRGGSAIFRCASGDRVFTYRELGGKSAFVNRYGSNHLLRIGLGKRIMGRMYVLPPNMASNGGSFVHGTHELSGKRCLITRCNNGQMIRCSRGNGSY